MSILSFEDKDTVHKLCSNLPENEVITFAHCFWAAIFNDISIVEIHGMKYHMKKTPTMGLRNFSMKHKNRELLFMEQNPNSKSKYAERARNGEKIMWVMSPRECLGGNGSSYEACYVNGRREK